ncbi:ABC transporter ATP-binding protein [Pseudonocardia alni]|uniref:ABC transporter ATP-binding protein n=1 Tax=Pseudonocardia alni TaxID=33907 RepID=UPI0033EEB749
MSALFVLVLVSPLFSAVTIWLFKLLVDDVLVPHRYDALPELAVAYTTVTLLAGGVSYLDRTLSAALGEDLLLRVRSAMVAHLHTMAPGEVARRDPGDLLARVTGDVTAIEDLVLDGGAQALSYLVQILVFVGAMALLDWRLTALALVAAPGFLLVARAVSGRLRRRSRERRDHVGEMTSVAEESLAHVAAVRAFGRATAELDRFDAAQRAARRATMASIRLQAAVAPLTDLLEVLGVLTVAAVAVHELSAGSITLGGLLVFVGYLTQLYGPVQSLGDLTTSLYSAAAGAERVAELLDLPSGPPDPVPTRPRAPSPAARGEIELVDVVVRHPGSDRPALDGVSARIPAGAHVAVVGASGSGKSTLVAALLRLLDPDSGSVRLDGRPLTAVPDDEFRGLVGVALQEPCIPDGTVGEVIGWGAPGASPRRIREAARVADADSFVLDLPAAYGSRTGPRGSQLSGGQRQRLSLARAVLTDAPVLVLDEPTSGLDSVTAARVLARITDKRRGRTTVFVTHDPVVVAHADLILQLDRGVAVLRPSARRRDPLAARS